MGEKGGNNQLSLSCSVKKVGANIQDSLWYSPSVHVTENPTLYTKSKEIYKSVHA